MGMRVCGGKRLMPVYFIQCPLGGPVKIGYSATVEGCADRLKSIRTGSHRRLEIIHIDDAATHEREQELHRIFRESRFRGEWFNPSQELAAICGCRLIPDRDYFEDVAERVAFDAGFAYANSEAMIARERELANKTKGTTIAIPKALKMAFELLPDGPDKEALWLKAVQAYTSNGSDIPPWLAEADPRTVST